jgi:hypothetical protein
MELSGSARQRGAGVDSFSEEQRQMSPQSEQGMNKSYESAGSRRQLDNREGHRGIQCKERLCLTRHSRAKFTTIVANKSFGALVLGASDDSIPMIFSR